MKNEHKPLFIPIGFYFTKRHIWRVKMFHKTIHNAWNLFKCLKQLPENLVLRVSIGREESSIDQMFFLINRTVIKPSNDFKIIFFIISIDRAKASTNRKYWISNFTWKFPEFEFSLYKTIFSKFKYHYYNLVYGSFFWTIPRPK